MADVGSKASNYVQGFMRNTVTQRAQLYGSVIHQAEEQKFIDQYATGYTGRTRLFDTRTSTQIMADHLAGKKESIKYYNAMYPKDKAYAEEMFYQGATGSRRSEDKMFDNLNYGFASMTRAILPSWEIEQKNIVTSSIQGGYNWIRKTPSKPVGTLIMAQGVGAVFKVAMPAAESIPVVGGAATKIAGSKITTAGMYGLYGASKVPMYLQATTLKQKGEVIGETVGEALAFSQGAKLGAGIWKPQIGTSRFNVGYESWKAGEQSLYKGITYSAGQKGGGLIGRSQGRTVVGSKPVDLTKVEGSFIVESPAQTNILAKSLRKQGYKLFDGVTTTKGFDKALNVMRTTETTKSKFIQDEWIKDVGSFKSQKGAETVLKFTKAKSGELYGSFSARQQMQSIQKKTGSKWVEGTQEDYLKFKVPYNRQAGDIDAFFKVTDLKAQGYAKDLAKQLTGVGENVRISSKTPTLIESKIGGKWQHAVDMHSTESGLTDIAGPAVAGEKIYGLRFNQKLLNIGGQKAMPLSEQGLRKGASAFTVNIKEGKINLAPAEHRSKDIADFFTTQESLLQSKPNVKASKNLMELKSMYPKELFIAQQPVKSKIYSPSKLAENPKLLFATKGKTPSPSRLPSISQSVSISPSYTSPSKSPGVKSPSISQSVSISLSPYLSPSKSPSKSPGVKSPSISISPSYTSPSKSPGVKSPSISISPSMSPSPYPFTPPPPRTPPPKKYIMPKWAGSNLGSKRRPAKRPVKYIPSFSALAFKQFGKYKKTSLAKTGLDYRPINKQFQISKSFKFNKKFKGFAL